MKGIKISVAILALAFVGCGGQGGVGTGFPDPPIGSVLRATGPGINGGTALRTYQAGDTWEYEVSGTMLREEFDEGSTRVSRNQGPVSGTMTRTITSVSITGIGNCFKVTDALTYKLNGGLPTVEVLETYISQNVSGNVTMLGRRQNSVNTAPGVGGSSQAWLPGTFGAGANVGGAGRFDNTLTAYPETQFDISTAFAVTGSSSVTADVDPVFTTWRALYTDSMHNNWDIMAWFKAYNISNGFIFKTREEVSSADEWSPVIGAPVARKYNSTRIDSVVHGGVDYTPPTYDSVTGNLITPESITYTYHTINRTLNMDMVLKRRSLQ